MGKRMSMRMSFTWIAISYMSASMFPAIAAHSSSMLHDIEDARKSYNTNPDVTIELWDKYQRLVPSLPKRFKFEWPLLASKAYLQKYELNTANNILVTMHDDAKAQTRSDYSQYFNLIGIMFRRAERFDLASAAYECAIQILQGDESEPRLPGYYNNLGIVYHLSGQYPKAITNYDKAIQLAANANARNSQGRYLYNKGLAFLDNQELVKAEKELKKAFYLKELPPKADRKNSASPLSQFKTAIALMKSLIERRDWPAYDRYSRNFGQLASKFINTPDYIVYQWFLMYADYVRDDIKPHTDRVNELVTLAAAQVVDNRGVDDVTHIASQMNIKIDFTDKLEQVKHIDQPERYFPILESCNTPVS